MRPGPCCEHTERLPKVSETYQEPRPEPHTVYVRFGPKDHQVIRLDVAEALISLWHERAPATFGWYLAEVMTGEHPRGRRS